VVKRNKTKIDFLNIITFHKPLWTVFPTPLAVPITSRAFPPFHIQTTSIIAKIKRLICSHQGLNP